MKKLYTALMLILCCTTTFGKDEVRIYTNDEDKKVVRHSEMECFDDMSDEAHLMWVDGEGYYLVLRLKKWDIEGTKDIDFVLNDGSVLKGKATATEKDRTYNPWLGVFIIINHMSIPLDGQMLDACLSGNVKRIDLYVKNRGEEPYTWERKRGKWNFDKNFKKMYDDINKRK